MKRLSELREKVIFAEIGLKVDYLTCVQNSKAWPGDNKPKSLWSDMGSQPYPELATAPDVGEKHGNHQMRCTVLSGLETHNLSGPGVGVGRSQEGMMGHLQEMSQAQ